MTKHRRGPWSQAEDNYLLSLVHSQGAHNWVRISSLIQSRSPKQCRERYHQNLKSSLNLDPISAEEGLLIERMVSEMGKRWAEIARRLHGRSDNAVKNWWNGGMNRRKRLDNRRADTAARQQPAYIATAEPRQPVGQMYPNTAASAFQQPQFTLDQRAPYPANLYPHHIQTTHLVPPARRSMMDTPLPSPGAISTQSHSETLDGSAPSLISEGGSYASLSPNTPPLQKELPSANTASDLRRVTYQTQVYEQIPQDYRRLSYPPNIHVDQHGHAYAIDPSLQSHSKAMPPPPPQQQQQPYWPREQQQQQQQQQQQHVRSVPYGVQLPLPSLQPGSAAETRYLGGPPSPPRDSRMNLKSVLQ